MIASPPVRFTVMAVSGGHLVIPYVLPIHVPTECHGMPVEAFFGIDQTETVADS